MSNENSEGASTPNASSGVNRKGLCVFLKVFSWSVMLLGVLWAGLFFLSAAPSGSRSSFESGTLGRAIFMLFASILIGQALLLLAKADAESGRVSGVRCPKVIRALQGFTALIGVVSVCMFIWAVAEECNCSTPFGRWSACDFDRLVARNFWASSFSEILSLEILGHGNAHVFKGFFVWASASLAWCSFGFCFVWGALGRVCSRVALLTARASATAEESK